jgi:hypothetical protein
MTRGDSTPGLRENYAKSAYRGKKMDVLPTGNARALLNIAVQVLRKTGISACGTSRHSAAMRDLVVISA